MNVEFVPAATEPENFHPLTCTRTLADCPVANRPFREAQRAEFDAARFALGGAPDDLTLFVRGNAWLHEQDLRRIKAITQPMVIRAADGDTLAWTGAGTLAGDATAAFAADSSLLVTFLWDLLRLNEILVNRLTASHLDGTVSDKATVDGHLVLGKGSRVLPGAYLEGNVIVGDACQIGPNCYVRGPTSIGHNCRVGNGVEIKASILLPGAHVGHLSYVGDSILGENVNLGGGTITANFRHDGRLQRAMVGGRLVETRRRKLGAVFGDKVHTGIHTSIYPGRKLWPGVTTLPGDVVRQDLEA